MVHAALQGNGGYLWGVRGGSIIKGDDLLRREMRQQHERSDAERQQLRERITSLEHALADAEAALAQNRRIAHGAPLSALLLFSIVQYQERLQMPRHL